MAIDRLSRFQKYVKQHVTFTCLYLIHKHISQLPGENFVKTFPSRDMPQTYFRVRSSNQKCSHGCQICNYFRAVLTHLGLSFELLVAISIMVIENKIEYMYYLRFWYKIRSTHGFMTDRDKPFVYFRCGFRSHLIW